MANTPRFHVGVTPSHFWVLDIPLDAYGKLETKAEQELHIIAKLRVGGMVSPQLGKVWATQICDQLNQFDIANATVAKLT